MRTNSLIFRRVCLASCSTICKTPVSWWFWAKVIRRAHRVSFQLLPWLHGQFADSTIGSLGERARNLSTDRRSQFLELKSKVVYEGVEAEG